MTLVCIDANVAVALVVTEPLSARADALFLEWKTNRVEILMPAFGAAEADSVIRHKVKRKEMTAEMGEIAFQAVFRLPIHFDPTDYRQRAWALATQFDFDTVYDAVYLALAEQRSCEFWTADRRLYERVRGQLGFVRLLGN
jgi:predicted nucleic acid-binding protein